MTGQTEKPIEKPKPNLLYQHPKYIVKYSVSSLMDVASPAVQIGLEQIIGKRASLQYEAGGIWGRYPFRLPGYGYSVRGEYRHYYHAIAAGDADNFYWSTQLTWRQTFVERQDWVDRYDGAFSQNIHYRNRRNIVFATFNLGGFWYISPNTTFETGFGLGLRSLTVKNVGLPEDAIFTNQFNNWPNTSPRAEGNYFGVAGLFILKVGKVF